MDATIVAALIGLAGTVTSAMITVLAMRAGKDKQPPRPLPVVRDDRAVRDEVDRPSAGISKPRIDHDFLARLKSLLVNTTVVVEDVTAEEASLSFGVGGEKYRVRLMRRPEDKLLAAESNVNWPPGHDLGKVEAIARALLAQCGKMHEIVDFVTDNVNGRVHLYCIIRWSNDRFASLTAEDFRGWICLVVTIIKETEEQVRAAGLAVA